MSAPDKTDDRPAAQRLRLDQARPDILDARRLRLGVADEKVRPVPAFTDHDVQARRLCAVRGAFLVAPFVVSAGRGYRREPVAVQLIRDAFEVAALRGREESA